MFAKFVSHYPKLALLVGSYLVAVLVFYFGDVRGILASYRMSPLFATMLGGLYAVSFSSAFATSFIAVYASEMSAFFFAVYGGIGSALADVLLLRYVVALGIEEELRRLCSGIPLQKLLAYMRERGMRTLSTGIGIGIIASPLPDELGVLCIAYGNQLPTKYMFLIGFIANAVGIFSIAHLARH